MVGGIVCGICVSGVCSTPIPLECRISVNGIGSSTLVSLIAVVLTEPL